MASREGSNPLRPYYVPHIGLSPTESVNASSAAHLASHASSRTTIGGSARDLLSELDYSDYLDASPSVSGWFKDLLDRAVWKYSSALLVQPFDVAKTLLQIYVVAGEDENEIEYDSRRRESRHFEAEVSDQVGRPPPARFGRFGRFGKTKSFLDIDLVVGIAILG